MTELISVSELRVTFNTPIGPVHAVRGVDFDIRPGEVLGIVGESGSGKSATLRAVLGLMSQSTTVEGALTVDGTSTRIDGSVQTRAALVYQNPGAALNPVFTIGQQLALAAGHDDRAELAGLLDRVGLLDPEGALDAYPHEFSGGMQQRAVIALALAQRPDLLIADEPTTALDVTTQAKILDLLDDLRRDGGPAIALVSHDVGVIRRLADRVVVMLEGEIVETGEVDDVLSDPQHEYTRSLLAAVPRADAPSLADARAGDDALLEIRGLAVDYHVRGRGDARRVINGLDLDVLAGETLALVGESGSGKSTLLNAVIGLVSSSGSIRFGETELVGLSTGERRAMAPKIQMVFQNALLSLSPRRPVGWQLEEPLRSHTALSGAERRAKVLAMASTLGLSEELLVRRPHELSGGQAQRVVLARALLLEPEVILFDEPTSALDVSVQADVLDLLGRMKREHELTYLFVTHDLGVARQLADRVAVMRGGEIVELGLADEVLGSPANVYTQSLLQASLLVDQEAS